MEGTSRGGLLGTAPLREATSFSRIRQGSTVQFRLVPPVATSDERTERRMQRATPEFGGGFAKIFAGA